MLPREPAPLSSPRRGVRKLGADRNQVAADRFEDRAGCLDGDMTAALVEFAGKRFDFPREQRLAARQDDIFGWMLSNLGEDGSKAPSRAVRLPRSVGRITPDATEIAARRPDKYRRHADQPALALDRIKYFADPHSLNVTKCRCGIQIQSCITFGLC